MTPFKKRKEAEAARLKQISDAHDNEERQFDAAIEAAAQLTDPAEKALVLKDIGKQISAQISAEKSDISALATNKRTTLTFAGLPVALSGSALMIVLTGPVGLAVGIPVWTAGMVGSHYLAPKRAKALRKKLEEAASGHMNRLHDQANRSYNMAVEVAGDEKNVEAISQSPLKDEILAVPDFADKFSEAAAKHIAASKDPNADAAPPAEAAPKKLRIIRHDKNL